MTLALSSLRERLSARVQEEDPGTLRDYLARLIDWTFNSANESEDTGRIGFLLCRPFEDNIMSEGFPLLTRNERQRGYRCLKDMFNTVMEFFYNHWALRSSIQSAPPEVQKYLKTAPATAADIKGLLERPYYERRKNKAHSGALLRFATLKRTKPQDAIFRTARK